MSALEGRKKDEEEEKSATEICSEIRKSQEREPALSLVDQEEGRGIVGTIRVRVLVRCGAVAKSPKKPTSLLVIRSEERDRATKRTTTHRHRHRHRRRRLSSTEGSRARASTRS